MVYFLLISLLMNVRWWKMTLPRPSRHSEITGKRIHRMKMAI